MGDRVLVLGGCGFIGRHIVKFLVDNNFAARVRVCDKVLPEMAFLSPELQAAFANPIVEFKQANLANPAHLPRAFQDEGGKFNVVINLAAETKYGQQEEQYRANITELRVRCATAAAEHGVDRYIEVSTAQVYEPESKTVPETGKLKPWTPLAVAHREAEVQVAAVPGLNPIIVRLPIVYGPGDRSGLMPRLICGAVYKHLQEKMQFLWTDNLKMYTVHVVDVARGIWHIVKHGRPGDVYNLCDKNKTNQEKIAKLLEEIFQIKTGFYGALLSTLGKFKLSEAASEANEGHMEPWAEMCKQHNIHSVLSPYIDKELLLNNPLSIDGSKIETHGFNYLIPAPTKERLVESIQYWVELRQFPPVL